MADLKISQLTSATTPLVGTEVLPIVQSGVTKQVAVQDLNPQNLKSNATSGVLQIAGPTAGTTRVMTTPDANFSAARTDAAQSLTNKQTISGTANLLLLKNDSAYIQFASSAGVEKTYMQQAGDDFLINNQAAGVLQLRTSGSTRMQIQAAGNVEAGADNTLTFGTASKRWSQFYAGSAIINTSDIREKQQIRDLDEAERAVALKIKKLLKAYKFNDAVAAKGEAARVHFGVMAQDVKAAFESEGLVADKYALFCYDEWQDEYSPVYEQQPAEDGSLEWVATGKNELVTKAGNRYGIRYSELFAFMLAAL